jgi:hypothetical protein
MAFRVLFGTIAPGTRQDWFFFFSGNGDRGAQYFLPHPLNPSGRLFCERIGKELGSDGIWRYHTTVFNQGPLTVSFNWDGGGVT